MDVSLFGGPAKSDPYLRVNVGDDVFDDRKNYIKDQTEVDFYKCIELHTELPGAGLLEIEVKDYDEWTSDDLIGKTVIDLEDRWFDERWKLMGLENKNTAADRLRWATKPLETRELFIPTSHSPQGNLECWVDIMPTSEADMFPIDDITLPPSQVYECQLVVWRARDMVSMDALEDMNDLCVRAKRAASEASSKRSAAKEKSCSEHGEKISGAGGQSKRAQIEVPREHEESCRHEE
jgi:hypothetical protein